jgi:hypothetical protein
VIGTHSIPRLHSVDDRLSHAGVEAG